MATYSYLSWETINLPPVTGDTDFIIYMNSTSTPGDTLTGIIYTGKIIDGYSLQNLNEILTQYLHPETIMFDPDDSILMQDDEQIHTFFIYYTQDDWETWTRDDITLTYNWSYSPITRVKSNKITNILDYRQYAVSSFMSRDGSEEPVQIVFNGSTIENLSIEGDSTWTYIHPLNTLTYSQGIDSSKLYRFVVNNSVYYITCTGYKFAIYYLNQYGGWDYMLFGGKELEKDNLSRLSYKKNYVAESMDFHKVDYLTTINQSWSLNTSWINDVQSEKMISLLATNKAYLHNLETQEMLPVNITSSTCEHKNYRNQGRKLYTYTVDVAASQPKYRV